jgi:hypothetical protein
MAGSEARRLPRLTACPAQPSSPLAPYLYTSYALPRPERESARLERRRVRDFGDTVRARMREWMPAQATLKAPLSRTPLLPIPSLRTLCSSQCRQCPVFPAAMSWTSSEAAPPSTVISRATKNRIDQRDLQQCVLCGRTPRDIVHIIARNSDADRQVRASVLLPIAAHSSQLHFVRMIHHGLATFQKDRDDNLISRSSVKLPSVHDPLMEQHLVCPTCHRSFDDGCFVFLPAPDERARMIAHEEADFAARQQAVDAGRQDPGRTVLPDNQVSVKQASGLCLKRFTSCAKSSSYRCGMRSWGSPT